MNTELHLVALFEGPAVPLDAVSKRYFGLAPTEARRKAALNDLPVPTFRLRDSEKAPLMVKASDLAAWIDLNHEKASASWQKSQV
jgi:hypothetical protein